MAIFVLVGLLLLPTLTAPPLEAATPTNGIIVRVANLQVVQRLCTILPCTVVEGLDGVLGQVFLIVPIGGAPVSQLLNSLLGLVGQLLGVVDAELDQTLNLVNISIGDLIAPLSLTDNANVNYYGITVEKGYTTQPAVGIINLPEIQSQKCTSTSCGSGIVADIDTGVDPQQPVLRGVLLQGYDFTRNQAGADETKDVNNGQRLPPPTSQAKPFQVNQMTMAVLDPAPGHSTLSDPKYAAFGHGTMTSGIIHLVAPTAKILPLKAFGANGLGQLSDILRAIYYATQNNANVLSMSFDLTSSSTELKKALTNASSQGVVAVASVGNDGKDVMVYPAGLSTVMGVASTSNNDTLSSFSNYGVPPVWLAAPGEGIVSPYPYQSYAAGWGTSFSAPFVSGTVALMRTVSGSNLNQSTAATAASHAANIGDSRVGHGRLDSYQAVMAWCQAAGRC